MKAQRYTLTALLCIGVAVGATRVQNVRAQLHATIPNVRVTVIGCIRRSEPPLTDRVVGTTVIPAGETHYVLSNITLVPPEGQTPTADGGSATTLLTEAVTAYRLDDSADALLAPHVGDRVRVTGSIIPTPPTPTGTAGRTPSSLLTASLAPMLRVESLHTIASDAAMCAP
jgi:hypothetical protein